MLTCLVAACLLSAQSTVIDFKPGADSLRAVVAQLAQESGENLTVDGEIAHEVVFVSAKSTPSEIRSRLAETALSVWTPKDSGWVLERTPQQKSLIWASHLELRRKLVDKALAEIEKETAKPFDVRGLVNGLAKLPDAQDVQGDPLAARARYQTEQQLFASGPVGRLMRKMLLACDRTDLAAIGPFERRVFRLKPNRRQGKINETAFRGAATAFAKEQAAWVDAAANANFPEARSGRVVSDPRVQTRISEKAALSAELVIRRGEASGLFSVNMVGETEGLGRGTICQLSVADASRTFLNSFDRGAAPAKDDPEVPLSANSKLFAEAVKTLWTRDGQYSPSAEILELISSIDSNEPLGWTVADVLNEYAKATNTNVVARLPDEAMTIVAFVSSGKGRLNQSIQALLGSGVLVVGTTGGWTRFWPTDRWEASIDFTPRAAGAKLLKSVIAKGRIDVRDYAAYAYESRRLNRGGLADILLALYNPTLMGLMDFASWDGTRLYGSFAPKAQQELERGAAFSYAGLNAAQKQIAERIVYSDVIRSEERLERGMSKLNHRPVEPTDEFPNGLPPGTQVTSKSNTAETIVAYGKDGSGKVKVLRSISSWTLAHVIVDGPSNPQMLNQYGLPNLVGFAPGIDRMFSLRVELRPGLWKETPMLIPEYDDAANPVAWEKLPDRLRKQIEASIAQLKEQRSRQGGGTPPPP